MLLHVEVNLVWNLGKGESLPSPTVWNPACIYNRKEIHLNYILERGFEDTCVFSLYVHVHRELLMGLLKASTSSNNTLHKLLKNTVHSIQAITFHRLGLSHCSVNIWCGCVNNTNYIGVGMKHGSRITDHGSEIILISIKSCDWLFHHWKNLINRPCSDDNLTMIGLLPRCAR